MHVNVPFCPSELPCVFPNQAKSRTTEECAFDALDGWTVLLKNNVQTGCRAHTVS